MPRLSIRICTACNKKQAQNYGLIRTFPVEGAVSVKHSSVHAGSIDLCGDCWNKHVNKRTLTLQRIEERIAQRTAKIVAAEQANTTE